MRDSTLQGFLLNVYVVMKMKNVGIIESVHFALCYSVIWTWKTWNATYWN